MIYNWIIFISWLAFILYWAISAFSVKKDLTSKIKIQSGTGYLIRLAIIFVIITEVVYRLSSANLIIMNHGYALGLTAAEIGSGLCVLGIALAIWARWHLGRNWSSRPMLKVGHELVTSGPYSVIRHPIYTGMLAAILGSVLIAGPIWFIVVVVVSFFFVRRVYKEEALMMQVFPDQYPEYKKRTKALIPFIW